MHTCMLDLGISPPSRAAAWLIHHISCLGHREAYVGLVLSEEESVQRGGLCIVTKEVSGLRVPGGNRQKLRPGETAFLPLSTLGPAGSGIQFLISLRLLPSLAC